MEREQGKEGKRERKVKPWMEEMRDGEGWDEGRRGKGKRELAMREEKRGEGKQGVRPKRERSKIT